MKLSGLPDIPLSADSLGIRRMIYIGHNIFPNSRIVILYKNAKVFLGFPDSPHLGGKKREAIAGGA
jgi:hypothetical protein